jgi:hypothetical protein
MTWMEEQLDSLDKHLKNEPADQQALMQPNRLHVSPRKLIQPL